MSKFKQGQFIPRNPQKYLGDPSKIRYMSSWEQRFHQFLDSNENILAWGSEEIAIPYLKPTDGKVHKYYPDYFIRYKNKRNEIVEEIVEIKPKNQITLKRNARLFAKITYAINAAKWIQAKEWCKQHNVAFRILTEEELFPSRHK